MKKMIFVLCFLAGISMVSFSQENCSAIVTLEIHNIVSGKGKILGGIYFTERSYKKRRHDILLAYNATGEMISENINLPAGECLITLYQDLDDDGKCKTGLFGIPKEPVGITNWDGSGVPGGFEKLKILIDGATRKVIVALYNL